MRIIQHFRGIVRIVVFLGVITNSLYADEHHNETAINDITKFIEVDGVTLQARIVNPKATAYEYIYLELTVANKSQAAIGIAPISFDKDGYLDYTLTDEKKQPLCYMQITAFWAPDFLITLNPGESETGFVNIDNIVCWPEGKPLPMMSPGRYHISIKIRTSVISGGEKKNIDLAIDDIPFDIVEATGDNAVALEIFENCLSKFLNENDPDEGYVCMQNILENYSETPYVIRAAQYLFHARKDSMQLLNRDEILNLRKQILLRYSESPYNAGSNIQNLAALISDVDLINLYGVLRSKSASSIAVRHMEKLYPWIKEKSGK